MSRARMAAWSCAFMLSAGAAFGAPAAVAHTGGANCWGDMYQFGATFQGKCEFPFQGFPIGVAGVYRSGETGRAAEIHVEVMAKTAGGFPRAIGVECIQSDVTDVARCTHEYNPLTAPITAVEPVPTEIVSLSCDAHSHASYSRLRPPSGMFACWSTNEARADLEADGVFAEIEG